MSLLISPLYVSHVQCMMCTAPKYLRARPSSRGLQNCTDLELFIKLTKHLPELQDHGHGSVRRVACQ